MLTISEQFANAGKQSFQSQIALLQKFSQKAFESSQKIIALNISTGKTLLGDNHEIAEHWIHSKHPFEFWIKDVHELQPGLHHLFHYERELAHIVTNAQAELLTFAFSEMTELQNELADLSSHLHEHNKAKQDVVKQAAHAYSAEIKSLYPQIKPNPPSKAAASTKAAEKAQPAAKASKETAAKAGKETAAKPAKAASTKGAAKAATKPAATPAPADKPVAKKPATKVKPEEAVKPVARAAAVEKPQAKASVASKARAESGAPASPKAGKAGSKTASRAAEQAKAQPAAADTAPVVRHGAEEAHRPPMPRPAVPHQLEIHNAAPSLLNLDNQVVE